MRTKQIFRLERVGVIGIGLVLVVALVSCGVGDAEKATEHLEKGRGLLAAGQFEAAVKELTKAAELDIDAIEPPMLLGDAYRALKQYDKAFEAYRAAKKVDRYVAAPHIRSALIRVEVGEIDVAIEELNHAIELDPENIVALVELGKVSRMPRPPPKDDAKEELGRFVNPDPRAGYERAELNLSQAVALVPDHIEANYELAKTYELLERRDEAVATWKKVRMLVANKPQHAGIATEAREALTRLSK